MGRYVDLALLLDVEGLDLDEVIRTARRWKVERALYGALRQAFVLFPERQARIEPLMSQLLSTRVRRHLDEDVLPSPFARGLTSRRQQVMRKFQLMDAPSERAAFLLYHVWASLAGRLGAGKSETIKPETGNQKPERS